MFGIDIVLIDVWVSKTLFPNAVTNSPSITAGIVMFLICSEEKPEELKLVIVPFPSVLHRLYLPSTPYLFSSSVNIRLFLSSTTLVASISSVFNSSPADDTAINL